jgi:hypothetical protein
MKSSSRRIPVRKFMLLIIRCRRMRREWSRMDGRGKHIHGKITTPGIADAGVACIHLNQPPVTPSQRLRNRNDPFALDDAIDEQDDQQEDRAWPGK